MDNHRNRNWRLLLGYLIPIVIIAMYFSFGGWNSETKEAMTHGQLIEQFNKNQVKSLVYQGDKLRGVLKDEKGSSFEVVIPREYFPEFYDQYIKSGVEKGQVKLVFEESPQPNFLLALLPDLLFMGFMGFILYAFYRRTQAAQGGMNTFGKSKAQLHKDTGKRVTFADVAGLKEEKEELEEVVDFLKAPNKYRDVGARIPKGILMVGPPGTGKTYLSKAVAGQAGVPFYSISGSDFVEMFVGVGASRVRDLFKEAKKNAPCIVFVDEIDAVGRRRGAGLGGGNDEREQTLNQLLVEMDGFDENEGIIIMAATNRPDILDPALLRPGRFDRRIMVGMPDARERAEILKVHLRNKHIADDVDLDALSRQTAGFTPADLENLTNEAALLIARKNEQVIDMATFEEAAIKVQAGPEKKSRKVVEKERILTAYHEAGHAVVTRALPDTDMVNLITIVPRGMAGGFTAFLPEDELMFMSMKSMKAELVSFLGGRAAEALFLDDISTGASNDIERATEMARSMVVRYGMSSDLGPVTYEMDRENVFLGNELGQVKHYSEETARQIDKEVRGLMTSAYDTAKKILEANRQMMENLARLLLDKETVRKDEFEVLFREFGHTFEEMKGASE